MKAGKTNKPLPLTLRVVPDTSIIIEGFLSRKVEKKEIKLSEVIIHESVMAELESQANRNRETGFLGLEEVKKLRELSAKHKFKVIFKGNRPTDFEIKHAKAGEIDSTIRKLAGDEKATLVTADKVQSMVAESKGISVILYEFEEEEKPFLLEKYFDKNTMSVHIREACQIMAKRGVPGEWKYEKAADEMLDREQVKELAKQIIEDAHASPDAFIESERRGSTIIQFGENRIVIARPPFSDGYEITVVRPVKKLALSDYALTERLLNRIKEGAEGILVAGAPGQGKSTFVQALIEDHLAHGKVVKTIESPRDLSVSDEISQYSVNHGSNAELQDILLLSRPDYTVFDEMRNRDDFRLFAELRLSGVGMVGVMHATRTIDAIQRFIGKIELGVIPHVVDTVIFISNGKVEQVYSVKMDVRVPSGMTESDLARPVVSISDFETGRLVFEIYTYGEQAVVVPVETRRRSPALALAEKQIRNELKDKDFKDVEMLSEYKCRVAVPIGAKKAFLEGLFINNLEEKLGLKIKIVEEASKAKKNPDGSVIRFKPRVDKKNIVMDVGEAHANEDVDIFIDGDFLITVKASKKGLISVSLGNAIGKMLHGSLTSGRVVEIRGK